ncbi:MAG: F0F1 ATP synthase subunit B [Oscillospiraceae bacterium]|nr:F0F1 ATP synthase subunit B [Oscillospiraceae bacterium]
MNTLYQSLVAVEPFTLIVTILNLFLQLYLIKKFLLDKVMAVLDQRREAADKQIREAEQAKQDAQEIRQSYESHMAQVKQEAGQIIHSAQKTAQDRSEQILRQAQAQASQIKEKAALDIAQEKKKAMNDAKNEISDMAMAIAGKVVGRCMDQQDQQHLVDEFIRELGDDL